MDVYEVTAMPTRFGSCVKLFTGYLHWRALNRRVFSCFTPRGTSERDPTRQQHIHPTSRHSDTGYWCKILNGGWKPVEVVHGTNELVVSGDKRCTSCCSTTSRFKCNSVFLRFSCHQRHHAFVSRTKRGTPQSQVLTPARVT